MNRKGIELSVNFIVMLVLAIVVFSFGLIFTSKLFTQAKELKADLDAETERNVEALLNKGDRVATFISSKEVKPGSSAIFAVGILNVLKEQTTFDINVTCSVAVNARGTEIVNGCAGAHTSKIQPVTIERTKQKIIPVAVAPPAAAGKGFTYGFTVTVTYSDPDNNYEETIYGGAPKQIYVSIS